jgi:hypothetical protein
VGKDPASLDAPLTESLRAVLEREKSLVLRSIKELEFDRAMGKVSPKDFDEMAGRLRARAMSLMRALDADSGYRELIERELSARLRKPASAASAKSRPALEPARAPARPARSAPSGSHDATSAERGTAGRPLREACACGTQNDPDAAFCKRCGTRLDYAVQS